LGKHRQRCYLLGTNTGNSHFNLTNETEQLSSITIALEMMSWQMDRWSYFSCLE
jgi:hypothetical protein